MLCTAFRRFSLCHSSRFFKPGWEGTTVVVLSETFTMSWWFTCLSYQNRQCQTESTFLPFGATVIIVLRFFRHPFSRDTDIEHRQSSGICISLYRSIITLRQSHYIDGSSSDLIPQIFRTGIPPQWNAHFTSQFYRYGHCAIYRNPPIIWSLGLVSHRCGRYRVKSTGCVT